MGVSCSIEPGDSQQAKLQNELDVYRACSTLHDRSSLQLLRRAVAKGHIGGDFRVSAGGKRLLIKVLSLKYTDKGRKGMAKKLVLALLDSKASVHAVAGETQSPLFAWMNMGSWAVLKALVWRGADLHAVAADERRDTFLHHVARYGSPSAQRLLGLLGPADHFRMTTATNAYGETVVHALLSRDLPGATLDAMLAKLSADDRRLLLNTLDSRGRSPLDVFLSWQPTGCPCRIIFHPPSVCSDCTNARADKLDRLLGAGALVDVVSADALALASPPQMRVLLARGVDPTRILLENLRADFDGRESLVREVIQRFARRIEWAAVVSESSRLLAGPALAEHERSRLRALHGEFLIAQEHTFAFLSSPEGGAYCCASLPRDVWQSVCQYLFLGAKARG